MSNRAPHATTQAVFRNRVAAVLWTVSAFWLCGATAMFYLLWRDGVPSGSPPWLVFVLVPLFCLGALAVVPFACSWACSTVRVLGDGVVEVSVRYPHRVIRGSFSAAAIGEAVVVTSVDSDGDPYFRCQLTLGFPFPEPVVIAEGRREHCLLTQARFNAAAAVH